MELDEFVKIVLSKIISGIRDAQEIEGVGPFIVPSGIGGHDYANHPRVSIKARLSSTIVDFDIAVTAEEGKTTSGGGGLKVAGIGARLEGESSSKEPAPLLFKTHLTESLSQHYKHSSLTDSKLDIKFLQ